MMFGLRAEHRVYQQQYYGGYCQKVREQGLEPMPYHIFTGKLDMLSSLPLNKKQRWDKLIEITRGMKNE